jgi:carotenoid cleavage dioxygenase
VNAHEIVSESGTKIVMDVCWVTRPEPLPTRPGPLGKLLGYLRMDARLHRYTFDLATGACTEEQLDDNNAEFPSIDTRRAGRPGRYAYTTHIADAETVLFDGLLRYDLVTGQIQEHRFGPGRFGSEAPFAPRDRALGDRALGDRALADRSAISLEDDGYLVTFVTDERDGRSEVQVLDAADLAAGPVARVLLPARVPLGFHATWVRADQLR